MFSSALHGLSMAAHGALTPWRGIATAVLFACCLGKIPPALGAPAKIPPSFDLPSNAEELRSAYVDDISLLRDYRPGKVSYVESPERRLGFHQKAGDRFTLLDLKGEGSIRHLWSTFQPEKGDHRLRFYFDGHAEPTKSGTWTELIAQAQTEAAVPVPGFVGRNYAYNLFTPMAFKTGAKIEMEVIEPVWIIFYQIDYRTEERSVPADKKTGVIRQFTKRERVSRVTINPGDSVILLAEKGPAILRKWILKSATSLADQRKIDLSIRYDGSPGDAVAATLGDFFGPFRSVALDTDEKSGTRISYLPMPYAQSVQIRLTNRSAQTVVIESVFEFEVLPRWTGVHGYFHARGQTTAPTLGYRQHQVLYVKGRGHWLGMSVFNTGHDHGGGDFAVIDGEGRRPAFLHGINGEDYFTFAWFGQGSNHPFAVAHPNDVGRIRFHYENPYPFKESFSLYWGTYPNFATRSVAYWYQDSPHDMTVTDANNALNVEWDCFGPVRLKLDARHEIAEDFYAELPSVADLDAGRIFKAELINESFERGWMKQLSIGPMLDLTYLSRQGTRVKVESELGGMGHAYLARRVITSAEKRAATIQFSHDDPVRVLVNGREVYRGGSHQGFATVTFPVTFEAGKNEVVVQLVNQFNVNFNWAGFNWLEVDPGQ